jgi:hypothetical protein
MGSRGTTVIDLLEKEWALVEASPSSTRQLRRWQTEDAELAPFATLAELRAAIEDRSTTPEARDRILLAVVRRAATDDLAARTLLQLLLPGCKAMVGRFGWTDDMEEVAAAVVAATYDRIRTYPVERRPGRIAANVLLDVKQRLFWRSPARVPTVCLDEVSHSMPAAEPDPHAAAELLDLLHWAVDAGHVSAADAQLIAATRVAGQTVDNLCSRDGEKPQTVRRRRQRAEQRLALAAAAAA